MSESVNAADLSTKNNQYLSSLEGLEYPAYDQNVNYSQEFWKIYSENETIVSLIKENVIQAKEVQAKLLHFQRKVREKEMEHRSDEKRESYKKKRRAANEIEKNKMCPYKDCNRLYGSEVSLNLHIKLKHNGGNKTERESLVRTVLEAKLRNEDIPEINLNLPPDFFEVLEY